MAHTAIVVFVEMEPLMIQIKLFFVMVVTLLFIKNAMASSTFQKANGFAKNVTLKKRTW
jgi:hypothetical protein